MQAREFRNIVCKWIEELKNDDQQQVPFPLNVPVRRSCLDDFKGERFEVFLLELARLTIEVVLKREFPKTYVPPMSIESSQVKVVEEFFKASPK